MNTTSNTVSEPKATYTCQVNGKEKEREQYLRRVNGARRHAWDGGDAHKRNVIRSQKNNEEE